MLLVDAGFTEMNEVRARPDNPSSSFRSSRRFACDRCRAYKARCERNGDLSGPCERCRKSRHACTTNFDNVPPSVSFAMQQQQQQQQSSHHWRNGSGENANGNGNIHNSSVHEGVGAGSQQQASVGDQPSFSSPQLASGRSSRQLFANDDGNFSRSLIQGDAMISGAEATDMYITPESSSRRLSSSHSTSGQPLVTNESQQLDDNGTSNTSNNNWLDTNYAGDLEEMDYSMDFSMPHLVFDRIDFAGLSDHHSTSRQNNSAAASAAGTRSAGAGDPALNVRRGTERPNNQNRPGSARKSHNTSRSESDSESANPSSAAASGESQLNKSYKDLLRLNLDLMEDEEVLQKQTASTSCDRQRDPQAALSTEDNLISRVLRRTSRFWEILSNIATIPEGKSRTASDANFNGDGSRMSRQHSWQMKSPNTLIIVHLITTYVSLIRICRAVFQHLYHVFQVIPSDQVGTVLNLPSLQLGEFQMENNLTIQVQALIELSCSMLLRIEEALGISTASGPGLGRDGVSTKTLETHHCRNSIMRDPVAVSLREIILSQERLHNAANEAGSPSLQVVMDNLKILLQRR